MAAYLTSYYVPCGEERYRFGSVVHARSEVEAVEICAARGLGETLDDAQPLPDFRAELPASWHWENSGNAERLHAICWLANLAMASGVADREELLGDFGMVHEAVHHTANEQVTFERVLELIQAVEAKVPGYLPPGSR